MPYTTSSTLAMFVLSLTPSCPLVEIMVNIHVKVEDAGGTWAPTGRGPLRDVGPYGTCLYVEAA